MLDAFIIEEIQRRERASDTIRPHLERPLPTPPFPARHAEDDAPAAEPAPVRGAIVIDRDDDDRDDDDDGRIVLDM